MPLLRRVGAALLVALLAAPAPAETPLCDGKYAAASEMLDAAFGRFGMIYTGGPLSSYSGADVGPTIDLWRLWHGLPDLRFRDAQDFDYTSDWGRDYSGFGTTADDLTLILRIAARPQASGLTPAFRYVTARYLNKMVDAGSRPGWWLAPGPLDQTDRQKLVMAAATPGSLMEWLMVMMAQSDTPQAVAWVNKGTWDGIGRYRGDTPDTPWRDLVSARAKSEPGLEWKLAAVLTDGAHGGGQNRFSNEVYLCTASQAEYAFYAVEKYNKFQHYWDRPALTQLDRLPDQMKHRAMANLAMTAVRSLQTGYDAADNRAQLDWIAAHSPSPEFTSWLNAGRVWVARDVAEIIALQDGAPLDWRTVDTLNLLSLQDLAQFADKAHLPADHHRMLITVLAARAFVQGDQAMARRYLTALAPLMPNYASGIDQALTGPGGDEVQNARALLALPRPTVWLRAYDDDDMDYARNAYRFNAIDLPLRFVSAGVLNRDLRLWMTQPFAQGRRYWGWDAAERARRRGRVYHTTPAEPFIPEDWTYRAGYPFLRLIAWDELGRLDACHGLTQRLSTVITDWADQGSNSWLDPLLVDQSAMPEALRRIVQLNRRSLGALINGQPAGQRAFALLSSRFAETPAARSTKYWYFTDKGCQP